MNVLLVRLEAPLMSFGGSQIDGWGPTGRWPLRSMLVGFLLNGVGINNRKPEGIKALYDTQDRLRYAVRCDRPGRLITDFQTVDLSLSLDEIPTKFGWSALRKRKDYKNDRATAIRRRQYLSDASYVVAIALAPGEGPSLKDLREGLEDPVGIPYVGRLNCLLSKPPFLGEVEVPTLTEALRAPGTFKARVPVEESLENSRVVPVIEDRDWKNGIVVGRRLVREGEISG